MLTTIYLLIGFFLAAGVTTGLIMYSSYVRPRVWSGGTEVSNQAYTFYALGAGFLTWFLWLPAIMFGIFALVWAIIFRTLRTRVRIDTSHKG